MLGKIIARLAGPRLRPEDLSFEEASSILERASEEAKEQLARSSHEPEILAYLAQDQKGEIRSLVAANHYSPREVDLHLAGDELEEVRVSLARKIARLLPDLKAGEANRIRELTLKVIDRLASDTLPHVRQIVAEEIKLSREVPREIALRLAHDAEIAVAAPILEYSPLLSDDDLLEIIATSEVEQVLSSIAKRDGLSADVSRAVVATLDIPAVTALLANQSAEIRAETLDRLVEHARDVEAWHQPLIMRPELSIRAIRRISGFVASSLLETLSKTHKLDEETRHQIAVKVRERIQHEDPSRAEPGNKERTWALVTRAASEGRLDDDFILDSIRQEDRTRTVLALVALARVPESLVERLLKSGSPQIITALAWHAGLQMRTAFALQKQVAHLNPSDLLPARNGVDFPLTKEQMASQLELMGIEHKE